jgi:hypothetical protein
MVSTAKKVAANRANAGKSTGPRTKKGKARSSRNHTTHGLLSASVVLPWESRHSFRHFHEGLMRRLAPQDGLEVMLAERVVAEAWRIRRAGSYETQVLEEDFIQEKNNRKLEPENYEDELPLSGGSILREMVRTDLLPKLSRYERQIERSLYAAMHELERLQAARKDRPSEGDQACPEGIQPRVPGPEAQPAQGYVGQEDQAGEK